MARIFSIIQNKTGHDFSSYKLSTIDRRMARRMAIHQLHTLSDYAKLSARDPLEPDRFVKDMLIGVTGFFRDSQAFATLQKNALVPLVHSEKAGGILRVWVAGCSSGEEAYSVAILIAETMAQQGVHLPVQIFASDIEAHGRILRKIGADEIYFPEKDIALSAAQRLDNPSVLDYLPFMEGCSIVQLAPPAKFFGKNLIELDQINRLGIQVIAVKETVPENMVMIPTGQFIVKKSGLLVLLRPDKALAELKGKSN